MKLVITNTDEVTVWLMFFNIGLAMVALTVLAYACALLLDVRHRRNALRPPERQRDDKDWPKVNGRQ